MNYIAKVLILLCLPITFFGLNYVKINSNVEELDMISCQNYELIFNRGLSYEFPVFDISENQLYFVDYVYVKQCAHKEEKVIYVSCSRDIDIYNDQGIRKYNCTPYTTESFLYDVSIVCSLRSLRLPIVPIYKTVNEVNEVNETNSSSIEMEVFGHSGGCHKIIQLKPAALQSFEEIKKEFYYFLVYILCIIGIYVSYAKCHFVYLINVAKEQYLKPCLIIIFGSKALRIFFILFMTFVTDIRSGYDLSLLAMYFLTVLLGFDFFDLLVIIVSSKYGVVSKCNVSSEYGVVSKYNDYDIKINKENV
jgi:hypothetical protein